MGKVLSLVFSGRRGLDSGRTAYRVSDYVTVGPRLLHWVIREYLVTYLHVLQSDASVRIDSRSYPRAPHAALSLFRSPWPYPLKSHHLSYGRLLRILVTFVARIF